MYAEASKKKTRRLTNALTRSDQVGAHPSMEVVNGALLPCHMFPFLNLCKRPFSESVFMMSFMICLRRPWGGGDGGKQRGERRNRMTEGVRLGGALG